MTLITIFVRSKEKGIARLAVQDGDYNHVNPKTSKQVTIAEVIDVGKEYLGVDYIFWCTEEPYYSEHLIPFMKR